MSDTADSRRAAGNAAFQLGQYDAAVAHYSAAIDLDRRDLRGWNNRAQAYLKTGQPLLAWSDVMHVLHLEPHNLKAMLRLAAAYMGMRMYDEVLQWCFAAPRSIVPSHIVEKQRRRCLKALETDTPGRANMYSHSFTFRAAPGQARHPDVILAAFAPTLGRIPTPALSQRPTWPICPV
jgi:tetratricopeptide (TPR) repeat protein